MNTYQPRPIHKTLLSASILGADWLAFGVAIELAESAGADLIQLDIADGIFTPTISFGEQMVKSVRARTDLPLEVHLMVSRPQDWFSVMADNGADIAIFHAEAVQRLHATIELCRRSHLGVGVALNSETRVEELEYVIRYVDLVTLMGILPGFAGQPFIPETLEKIARLRQLIGQSGSGAVIEVDGGIRDSNVHAVIEAGADVVVTSSAIYQADDPLQAAHVLRTNMELSPLEPTRGDKVGAFLGAVEQRRDRRKSRSMAP